MIPFRVKLNVGGDGLWSDKIALVTIKGFDILENGDTFGELRLYFDRRNWDTYRDGLIYTDRRFERELIEALNAAGYPGKDVDYSEQGMQGDDYVSFDIGKKFLDCMKKKHPYYDRGKINRQIWEKHMEKWL